MALVSAPGTSEYCSERAAVPSSEPLPTETTFATNALLTTNEVPCDAKATTGGTLAWISISGR